MNFEKEQDCMRVCYTHWKINNNKYRNAEEMSIITYAMLLEVINKSEINISMDQYIERAKTLYHDGLQNGWMNTH